MTDRPIEAKKEIGAVANQKEQRAAIKAAVEALSDLNTFDIVVTTLEGGHLHAPSYAGADRIIAICQREQAKRLREYDRAIAKALAARSPAPPFATAGA